MSERGSLSETGGHTTGSDDRGAGAGAAGDRVVDRLPERLKTVAGAIISGLARQDRSSLDGRTLEAMAAAGTEAIERYDGAAPEIVVSAEAPQGRTILAIANRDQPFLVDSVMSAVTDADIDVALLAHPVFEVARDASGRLSGAPRVATGNGEGHVRESLIVLALDDVTEPVRAGLVAELAIVLRQVGEAVADWHAMMDALKTAMAGLERGMQSGLGNARLEEHSAESLEFCRWLLDGHFTFLGTRLFRLDGDSASGAVQVVEGSNLGVLRDPNVEVLRQGRDMTAMTQEVRDFYLEPRAALVTKSNVVSRVHRRAHMDYVGLKTFGPDGALTGELRIVGLFTSKAYMLSPQEIPLLRLKTKRVIAAAGYAPGSHDAKALVHLIDTFPRDELFQIDAERLGAWLPHIMELENRPQTRVFVRPDRFNRFISALVYIRRERFSTAVREEVGNILAEAYGGEVRMFQPYFTDGRLVRVHFIIARFEGEIRAPDEAALEADIAEATRTWRDRLANAITSSETPLSPQAARYCAAFPAGYAETFSTSRALDDARAMEQMAADEEVAVRFMPEGGEASAGSVDVAIYARDKPLPLSERVPVLEQMGFRVIDEQSFRVPFPLSDGAADIVVHDMHLKAAGTASTEIAEARDRLGETFQKVQSEDAESDGFNGLVLSAGLAWREVAALRAYALYLRQTSAPFAPDYVAETLLAYPAIAADLLRLFDVRFNPALGDDIEARERDMAVIRSDIEPALETIPSLDQDRLIRNLIALIDATVRTNFYQRDEAGAPPEAIAYKFDSRKLALLPDPKPYREIWVYSPRVEGVHLRFAPIARGGLRWSDRPQDFRTEVLGLAKAQQVKNTVIVPEGAKGGFVPKRLPREGGRDAVVAEAVASYQLFIGTLLDITDNIVDGAIVPPERVVRYDGDDPYLVVAADKGTATFSDYANAISQAKGHWLGDAFASGGSAGYDHKKMGITARGAWECVKRHFREMDRDIQSEPFTVVGVGDMSGDVFGNGMLLSKTTRLIAAFDHRDIFIDPDPDAAASFAERERLFALGRSSWQDYDKAKISKGGGIFPRSSKSIPLSAEAQSALGLEQDAATPNEVMRAILKASVDLLWFGGIGTYIKSAEESDDEVGDRANNAIRIIAADVGAKVIGEGANLGVTQRGRIAFAANGGRLNADFIDNSAGVNSSDLEVNIKIAFGQAIAADKLDEAKRNTILEQMTEQVAEACLWNNRQQALAISLASMGSERLGFQARLMEQLEARGLLDRELEELPTDTQLAERSTAGLGLYRPEVAVLLSYAKIAIAADLMRSTLADDPTFETLLFDYFPDEMHGDFASEIRGHQLAKNIIVTRITNVMVNRGGPAVVMQLADETGRTVGEIAK
ncbi:MAG: NAD-glutamate dehydrogenase, partial [Pseudomonadota bacterium]